MIHDRATLADCRRRLEDLRDGLLLEGEAGAEGAGVVELDQSRVGRLSRMDALQAQAMSAEAQRRRRARLSEVRAALERLDAGEYGACLSCGEAIVAGRLAIDPAATLCLACASQAELK